MYTKHKQQVHMASPHVEQHPEVRTFWFENQLIMVVNPLNVESLPGLAPDDPEQSFEAADLRKALWAKQRCLELAYTPKSYQFTCSLLECLNCYVNDIPLICTKEWTKEGWMLNLKAQKSWHTLELTLYRIINILTASSTNLPEVRFCGIKPFWSPPTDFSYLKRILERSGVLHEWIEELCQSFISEFRIGICTGAFINPHPDSTPWMMHLPYMVQAKLPVYIMWSIYENDIFDRKMIDNIVREQPLVKLYTPNFDQVWVIPDLGDPVIVSNPQLHAIWTQSHFRWDKI
ncbi:hypothetical protein V8D89_006632 [Ganoderma adspersum]